MLRPQATPLLTLSLILASSLEALILDLERESPSASGTALRFYRWKTNVKITGGTCFAITVCRGFALFPQACAKGFSTVCPLLLKALIVSLCSFSDEKTGLKSYGIVPFYPDKSVVEAGLESTFNCARPSFISPTVHSHCSPSCSCIPVLCFPLQETPQCFY